MNDVALLADLVARAACREVPAHLCEIRAAVHKAARRAVLDALETAADVVEPPCPPGHVHEAAWVPAQSDLACVRRLPEGGRCPVRFRAYLPALEAPGDVAPAWATVTGRHEWPVFDEADVAPPNGAHTPSPFPEGSRIISSNEKEVVVEMPLPPGSYQVISVPRLVFDADGTAHVEPVGPARPFPGEGVGFAPEPAFPAPAPDVFDFGAGHDDADGASR